MGVERAGAGDKVAPERVPLDAGVVSKGRSGEVIGAPARAPEVAIGEITLPKAVPGACGTRVGAPRDPVAEEMFAVGAATAVGAGAADIACKF